MTADPRLIVPLDLPTTDEARAMVERLGEAVSFYKIGLELLATDGMGLARELKGQAKQVFLDWKLHDIGATVERSARVLAGAGCDLLTVHAEPQVMTAAVKAKAGSDLKILAVTVLTSLTETDLRAVGVLRPPAEQVELLARLAVGSGAHGLVCSAEEVGQLRTALGPQPILVTPGIRPHGAQSQDQKRTSTPGAAIQAGASLLVVGRPIRDAADPTQAARAIAAEIEAAL